MNNNTVLIVGSNRTEALESSYRRAFTMLGWQVQIWDPIEALGRVARGGKLGRIFCTFVHIEPWLRKANLHLLELTVALQPQLILVIGTTGVRSGTLAQIKVWNPKTSIYCLFPDSPHNLDVERIQCLPFFDRVMTSSPAWQKAFEIHGAAHVEYLPFAADTELYQPATNGNGDSPLAHDITFIGTWRRERESLLEHFIDFDLQIWGSSYWKHRVQAGSPLKERWGGRSLIGPEFAQACIHSKVLLNIMDPVTWPGPNMRTFELPACRAFALVERTPAVLDLFQEGKTIECFESVEEARDKIQFYLKHEAARQKIAAAGYQFVMEQGHTYCDRAQQLLTWLEQDNHR